MTDRIETSTGLALAALTMLLTLVGCTTTMPEFDCGAECQPTSCGRWHPGHYLLPLKNALEEAEVETILANPENQIAGLQIGATWRALEPTKGVYDFSEAERLLALAKSHGKQVFFQLQERTFEAGEPAVPDYLLDGAYGGGIEPWAGKAGSVARLWDQAVMGRMNLLIEALGARFGTDPNFEGINFPESALDIDVASAEGFTIEGLMTQLKLRIDTAVAAFPAAIVMQYINYGPDALIQELIEHCRQVGAAIGGPDLVPDQGRFDEKPRIPAYKYYPAQAGHIPLGSAVQKPNLLVNNKKGNFTLEGFWDMGLQELQLNYIFWGGTTGPECKFTFVEDILPFINAREGKINEGCPASRLP